MTVKTIKFKRKPKLDITSLADSKGLIILTAIFICGLILGSGTIGKSTSRIFPFYSTMFNEFFNWQINADFSSLLCSSFLITASILLLIFLASQSCIGIPVIFIINMLTGLIIGGLSGTAIIEHGITGLEYNILTLVPTVSIAVLLMLLLSNNSLTLSGNLLKYSLGIETDNNSVFKAYVLYVIKITAISFISSFVYAITVTFFIKLFNF